MVPTFRINLPVNHVYYYLTAHYMAMVRLRGMEYIDDANNRIVIFKLADALSSQTPKCGIMLCGTCGNGKTTLVYAIQSYINSLNSAHHFTFLGNKFHVGLEVCDVKDVIITSRKNEEWREFCEKDMIAIDDLGKEPAEIMEYGNVKSPVVDLLEIRYQKRKFTIVTSNLAPAEIKLKYGERIADRFREMFAVIPFEFDSYRKMNGRRQP
ncbi:DnaA ATPase domain-containing protein [Sodaliphilus sp.]|uniref:DnaA ATPase domain-containing protein n=1 Tax=Sodaliphilus sp. TaxID=2815818 RepID=UPI00388E0898